MMLAVLPRRQADDIGGELFVAAYERELAKWPEPAIDYMTSQAIARRKWFPTVFECLQILEEWTRPPDKASARRDLAKRIVADEEDARKADAKAKEDGFFEALRGGKIAQDTIDTMPHDLIRDARSRGALVWNADIGKFTPPPPCEHGSSWETCPACINHNSEVR